MKTNLKNSRIYSLLFLASCLNLFSSCKPSNLTAFQSGNNAGMGLEETAPTTVQNPVENPTENPTSKPTVTPEQKPATPKPTIPIAEPKKALAPKGKLPVIQPQAAPVTAPAVNNGKPNGKTTDFEPLAWENNERLKMTTSKWTKMIYQIIEKETPELLGENIADDVEIFCPKYRTLRDSQRMNFWGQLIVGIAKYESGWNPITSSVEVNMTGTDSVTGKHIASEGLLQLSYQDDQNYPIKCGFDWNKDKNLTQKDPRKTIFDPYLNLNCGIQIFANQLKRFQLIVVKDTRQLYWSVIFEGQSNKIKEIAAMTNSLSFCK